MIIPVNNITNDFNEFHHNIINDGKCNQFNTVINGSDDADDVVSTINDGQIDTGFDDRNITIADDEPLPINNYVGDNTITFDDSSDDNDIQMLDNSQTKNAKGRVHG
eukprot:101313_1